MAQQTVNPRFNPSDHPIIFSPPQYFEKPSAWTEHIPFGMLLVDLLRPRTFVELGAYYGISYAGFCQAVRELHLTTKCYAVDTWEGDQHAGFYGPEVLSSFRGYHDPAYSDFSYLLHMTFDDAARNFADSSIDLLHIDGFHTYEAAERDFQTWLPKMSSRGVVLFHDINVHISDFGVWKLWDQLKTVYPYFELMNEHGLGLIAVGNKYPRSLDKLLTMSGHELVTVRRLFHSLGSLAKVKQQKAYVEQAQIEQSRQLSEFEQQQIRLRAEHDAALQQNAQFRQTEAQLTPKINTLEENNARLQKQLNETLQQIGRLEHERSELTRKTNSVEERVSGLLLQLEMSQQQIASLTANLATRDQQIEQVLQSTELEQQQLVQMREQAAMREALLEKIQPRINERNTQIKNAYGTIRALQGERDKAETLLQVREALGEQLQADLVATQGECEALVSAHATEVAALQREAQTANAEIMKMRETRGWRALEQWWKIKSHITPIGYWHRLQELVDRSRLILRAEGPIALLGRLFLWLRGERRFRNANTPALTLANSNAPSLQFPSQISSHISPEEPLPTQGAFYGVSIIIPVFNALEYAKACVESIYAARTHKRFEVIVIDNGSNEDVLFWLETERQKRDSFKYIRLPQNLGFAKAVNIGIQHANGQYIIILNSDTLVTTEWIDGLVNVAESDSSIGIVSPKTNYVGDGPQLDRDAMSLTPEQANNYAQTISNTPTLCEYVTTRLVFFCVLVRRNVAILLSGLDEGYKIGNFEDDDFCVRAKLAGFKLAIASRVFVYHYGSKSFTQNMIDHEDWMQRNRLRFLERQSILATCSPMRHRLITYSSIPQVSVIVRTRNRLETLDEALKSLANQTLDSFEVVIVNDGGENIEAYLQKFERSLSIQYVHHAQQQGRATALNSGNQAARGRYLAYLDDDDIAYPCHLETLCAGLVQSKGVYKFVYSDFVKAFVMRRGQGSVVKARKPVPLWEFKYDDLMIRNYLPIHTWMFEKAYLQEIGDFDEDLDLMEDWDFLLRFASKYDFLHIQTISCEYRLYADMGNSVVSLGPAFSRYLEKIYERYPVNSNKISRERALELDNVQAQRNEILALRRQIELEPEKEAELQKKILIMRTGFTW